MGEINVCSNHFFEAGFIDLDMNYKQEDYSMLIKNIEDSVTLNVWKNDIGILRLAIFAKDMDLENMIIKVSDFLSSDMEISGTNVKISVINETSAFSLGKGNGDGTSDRKKVFDVVTNYETTNVRKDRFSLVLMEVEIPKDVEAGIYNGKVSVYIEDKPEEVIFLELNLDVKELELNKDIKGFDIELWQYPYSSAEYYGLEPFSTKHLEVLKDIMRIYRYMGSKAITATIVEEAWGGQTYTKNKIAYPSMVRWDKKENGYVYDYSDLDAWIKFNETMGEVEKIALYSISPWNNSIGIHENGEVKFYKFVLKKESDKKIWFDFLTSLANHLEANGWLDKSFIAIDEQGFSEEAFDLVESIKTKNNNGFKISAAMDHFTEKKELAMRVDDLTIGANAATSEQEDFSSMVDLRDKSGLKTTIYSCTGHAPGQFTLSNPVEAYWIIVDAWKRGAKGFLRWALDAWVDNPLIDTSHKMFEPGDCFLVYPDYEKMGALRSFRLVRMQEAIRDIQKAMILDEMGANRRVNDFSLTTRNNEKNLYLSVFETLKASMDVKLFKESLI